MPLFNSLARSVMPAIGGRKQNQSFAPNQKPSLFGNMMQQNPNWQTMMKPRGANFGPGAFNNGMGMNMGNKMGMPFQNGGLFSNQGSLGSRFPTMDQMKMWTPEQRKQQGIPDNYIWKDTDRSGGGWSGGGWIDPAHQNRVYGPTPTFGPARWRDTVTGEEGGGMEDWRNQINMNSGVMGGNQMAAPNSNVLMQMLQGGGGPMMGLFGRGMRY